MENSNFKLHFLLDQEPSLVFKAINNVRGWWSEELEGDSENLNDEFIYRHGDFHYSKHQLTELIPNEKIVWLTLDSKLSFVPSHEEWNGTKVIFEISKEGEKTKLDFTHMGLIPDFQCYEGCSKGWTHYLKNSLIPLILTGIGKPDPKK